MKIDQLIDLIRDYGRLDSATFNIVEREIRGDAMSKSTVLIVRSMFDKMEKADRSAAGRLAAQARWKGHVKQQPVPAQGGASGVAPAGVKGYQRPEVFRVKTIEAAIAMMNEGKTVELDSDDQVHTLLTELAKIAEDAKAKGQDAPNYDLCKVTVPGTNLFCGENQGVPRSKMPQLRSKPVPGSEADKLPKNKWGEVEGADIFQKHLEDMGISVKRTEVLASNLKATQTDMKGTQIALMMIDPTFDPKSQEIWVTRDGYILDGHHRWAASIGSDAKDGKLGEVKMRVKMIDASISEILPLANAWTQELGLQAIAGPATAPNALGTMEPAVEPVQKENVPTDKELYARVKAEAKKKFDVYPSAYANGWLVQEYKRRGGKYKIV